MGFLCFGPFSSSSSSPSSFLVFNLFGFVCFAMEQVAGACVTLRSQWRNKRRNSRANPLLVLTGGSTAGGISRPFSLKPQSWTERWLKKQKKHLMFLFCFVSPLFLLLFIFFLRRWFNPRWSMLRRDKSAPSQRGPLYRHLKAAPRDCDDDSENDSGSKSGGGGTRLLPNRPTITYTSTWNKRAAPTFQSHWTFLFFFSRIFSCAGLLLDNNGDAGRGQSRAFSGARDAVCISMSPDCFALPCHPLVKG